MSSEQKPSEKGNVARMVDRLSKDLGAGTGILTKTENVPLRNRVVTNNAVVGGVGAADSQQILGCIIPSTTAFDTAVVRYSYTALQKDELDLKEGDELLVLESVEDGWARGEILHSSGHPARKGLVGLYPTNFVSTISSTQTTQTGPSYNSAGSTATFPRAIGTTNAKEHQQENNNGNRSPEVADGISPLSKSAPKSSSNFMISNDCGSESDGGTECGQSAIGVVRTGNVLPSTLLKTGNINAGGMAANNSGGGGNTRRAVSTLIGGTSGGNNSVGIGMNSPASATAKTAAAAQQQQQHTPPHHQPPLHAKAKEFAKVLYKYEAAASDELSLPEGAIVTVATRQCEDDGWFVAELPDGRCGLFPDNFVNFYPAELTGSGIHLHQQQISPNNHSYPAPPSLPAKPQKFVQPQLQQQQLNSPASVPPPIASARDSLSALVVNVMSSSSANDSNNPGNPLTRSMELTESKKGIATSDNKMENISGTTTTNNNAGNSAHKNKVFDTTGTDGTAAARPTAPTSTATTAEGSNRHSRIVAIQDILKQQLPPGRLPMQRPPSLGAKPADNVEPKMPDMESPVSEAQQQQKQQQDAFVKSRTKIAPTNKRPPSKVNSAAVVASESANNNTSTSTPWIQKSFPSSPLSSPTTPNKPQQQLPPLSLDTKILQDIHQPTSTTVSATTNAGSSNATAGASKSTVFPSQSGGPPSPSAPHQSVQTLLCTLGEEQKQPEVQLLKASHHFQPPIVPPASSSSHFKAAHSPSNSSVASAATDITMGSSSVFPLPPSSSASTSVQWVGRADFDRFAEECQRKFADMQAEIRELRQRVETAHNK